MSVVGSASRLGRSELAPDGESVDGQNGPTETPDAPAPGSATSSRLGDIALPITVFVGFIVFWYLFRFFGLSEGRRWILPAPHNVIKVSFIDGVTFGALANLAQKIVSDVIPFVDFGAEIDEDIILIKNLNALWLSAKVAAVGLAFATVLGMAAAVLMSRAKWIERSFYPYAIALQAVPILAVVPLIGIWFGFGFMARAIVCVIISFFPIMANTLFGIQSVDQGQHDLFTLHGASRMVRLRKLQFPAASPAIFTGLRIAAGLSVIGAIVGDFFFRRGQPGIGSLLDVYASRLQSEELFGAIILSSMLGIVTFLVFGWLNNRFTGSWYAEEER